ncbi:MAG TPA: hypothetical protein VKB36_14615 [Vicinamibacterales bacterium]|nr:hypothetical protein [Vicinamibacterales bacterium]
MLHAAESGVVRFFVLAFLVAVVLNPLPASADLEFFAATDSDAAYAKNPSRYDRVRLPPGSAADVVFVERNTILSIPLGDIQSVTIERRPFAQNMEDAIRQMQGMPPQSGSQAKDRPAAFDTTFVLTPKSAQRMADLANAHDKALLDVRLNGRRLGVARVVGPLEGNGFQLYLSETDLAAVQRLFKPIDKKVLWKNGGN